MKFAKLHRMTVLFIAAVAVCALLVACGEVTSAGGEVEQKPVAGSVVSIDKTGEDDAVYKYTMKFSDGSTYSFEIDKETESPDESVYELFIKHNPDYKESEQVWLESLLDGTLFGEPDVEKHCILEVCVTDEDGEPLSGATVSYGGYTYLTSQAGRCSIISSGGGKLSASYLGYVAYEKTITAADIEQAGGSMTVDCKLSPVVGESGYTHKSENFMTFAVPCGGTSTTYYWYVEYSQLGITVTVDVFDGNVVGSLSNLGMNDNIEFVIQPNSDVAGYCADRSLNVLATVGRDGGWARWANAGNAFDADILSELIEIGAVKMTRTRKNKLLDGIDYTSIEVFMNYALWDISRDEAIGNFTICPAARNSSASGESKFRSYVGKGCIWAVGSTFVRIEADGKLVKNYFDLPDLEERLTQMPGYVEDTSLANDMASVSSSSAVLRKYEKGVPIFTDRMYYVESVSIPDALDGATYLYGAIDIPRDFTVESDGYIVAAVPADGTLAENVAACLTGNGFEKIASFLPSIGHGTWSSFIAEHTDYYAKYCSVGERYELPKWAVVFCRSLDSYEKNNWETTAAEVIKLDTPEKVEKYAPSTRLWQGIPGIESVVKSDGTMRLFACWFTGGEKEPSLGNYAVVYYSDDEGKTWQPAFVVGFDENTAAGKDSRVLDPSLFVDDDGRLWVWWNQSNATFAQVTTWYAKIDNVAYGDAESFSVSDPTFVVNGMKLNKPVKLSTGEWLFCAHDFTDMGNTKVYSSTDKGATWKYKGMTLVPNARFVNESALVETKDAGGKPMLIMWNRCTHSYNVAVSYSYDFGATWTDGEEFYNPGPQSRINAVTLSSGNILYVHYYESESRNNLCAFLSTDGGKSLSHALVLDTRHEAAYPDITVADGNIYIIWDFNRYIDKQILMTVLTENELLDIDGMAILDGSRVTAVSSLTLGRERADVAVSVTDGDTPIVGATVTLSAPWASDITATTDEKGVARFADVPAEEYTVTANMPGYYGRSLGLTTAQYIDARFIRIDASLALERAELATVSGTVTDMFTGEPIAGAAVEAGGVTATSGEDGGYSLVDVPTAAKTLTVSAEGYSQNTSTIDPGAEAANDVQLAPEEYTYIGELGGTVGDVTTMMWRSYIRRDGDGIHFAAVGNKTIPADGKVQYEVYFHVGNAGSTRTANTAYIDFLSNGYTRSYNFPSGSPKTVHALKADNSAEGITLAIADNVMTIDVTYAALSKACGGAEVDALSVIGINFVAGQKTGNSWTYVDWYKEQTPLDIGTGSLPRANPSVYPVLHADGRITVRGLSVDTAEELNAAVAASAIGRADTPLTENMAAFDISSPDVELRTVETGSYMYDDRTIHFFNGKQVEALSGMSFLYDGVYESASVTVTKSGYLLMYSALPDMVPSGWTLIFDNIQNPGILTSEAIALYALWAEAGDVVEVVRDGILMTNGISAEILVFGDSYTDAHVRKFWKNWDKTMAPRGAKTIGISGSRIDTPTGGDAYGWLSRARSGEIAAYRPKKILINVGVNDLDNGVDAHVSAAQLIALLEVLREQLPDTDIYYTLVVDNIMFVSRANQYAIHNDIVEEYIRSTGDGKLHVIDFRARLYTSGRGSKKLDPIYYADNLHLSAEGYALWVDEIYKQMGLSSI